MTPSEMLTSDLSVKGFVSTQRPALLTVTPMDAEQGKREDLWFFGSIATAHGRVRAYLRIPDMSFVTPPEVLLAERPSWLKGWRPHLKEIGGSGIEFLCFSDHEKYQLLAHAPSAAIYRMIEDARETLDRIAEPATVLEDSKKEMTRLWQSDGGAANVYLDSRPTNGPIHCKTLLVEKSGHRPTLIMSTEPAAVAKKLGITEALKASHDALVYPTVPGEELHLTDDGPPADLRAFAAWLKGIAPKTYALWHAEMRSPTHYQNKIAYHFFRCGSQFIGYFVDLPKTARSIRQAKEVRTFLAEHVYGKPLAILRLNAHRMDEEYLVRRSLVPGVPDLRGLQVLLVGAGAIGGFLAQNLVQLGAGGRSETVAQPNARQPSAQKSGTLHICDRDVFTNGNVGRHVLGTQNIGKLKASALKDYLQQLRPGVLIEAIPAGFDTLEIDLFRYDVIIDATGYETFGRHVSRIARDIKWLDPSRLLLHTWLEGRGGVVRCLSQDKPSCACYSCMTNYGPNIEPAARHYAYSDAAWNVHGDDGYATMTPFAVSAPMSAAALATDALLAWRAGNCSPRFRSRSSEGVGINPSMAKDLTKAKGCPGCSS